MRHLTFAIALFACAAHAAAQEQHTIFSGPVPTGSYGGPVAKITTVRDQAAILVGGHGGWILNHRLILGAGGYGVVNEVNAADGALPSEGPLDVKFGYGGFEVEYLIHPNRLGHFGVSTLIGAGANNYVKDVGPIAKSNEQAGESDVVFVMEPGVTAELNILTWLRLNGGVSYRLVRAVDQNNLKNRDFSGLAATVSFRFGRF